ncbi:MAG: hypothetical protein M1434_09800 [Chloroflexi bacterium]|nr:hypothetical protein [Chloroflexota bacterium]MCL5275018.1 hypothetical protein [Chloroflexota bacterium]
MDNSTHTYRQAVTIIVRRNRYKDDCVVVEVRSLAYRDQEELRWSVREYSTPANLATIQHKISWVVKPLRVCEVDDECPDDQRLISTTIDWYVEHSIRPAFNIA